MNPGPFIVLGCGYIGSRVARAALALKRDVRVCSRSATHLEPLRQLGADVRTFDAFKLRTFGPALEGTRGATVLYSVPPLVDIPSGEAVARAAEAAMHVGARSFIYLSSSGLYGDMPDDAWVDEDTPTVHDDAVMSLYHTDESAVQSASFAGLRTATLRLAAVYGPGRGVRVRLRAGEYKLLDGGKHWVSRIHVDDLARIIFAAEQRAPQGSLYVVGDDRPTTQREYAEWLCERLDLPLPPSVASYAPGMRRTPWRGRRIRNDKLKRELNVTLQYPTFVEGEGQIEAEERGPEAPAEEAAPPPPAAVERPPFVLAAAAVKGEARSYPGSDEPLGVRRALADAVGLKRTGVNLVELPPGQRTSFPHAHSTEEELVYVLEGAPDLWVDGRVVRLAAGDVVGLPGGTGVAHSVLNNGSARARLLVIGERRDDDRVFYPLHSERQAALAEGRRWGDAPRHELGPHDGKPKKA